MTREEAIRKLQAVDTFASDKMLNAFEALGLLKFDDNSKQITNLIRISSGYLVDKYGVLKCEEWPEGLVIWVGGEIVYKSWLKHEEGFKPSDLQEIMRLNILDCDKIVNQIYRKGFKIVKT